MVEDQDVLSGYACRFVQGVAAKFCGEAVEQVPHAHDVVSTGIHLVEVHEIEMIESDLRELPTSAC